MQEQTIKSFTEYKGQSQRNSGPSDLLIPLYLESYVLKQIRKHKNLRNYFHFLIVKFQKKNLFSKFSDTAFRKTLYQSKHLQLIRYSFRPDHQDWYEAKFAGFYFGISVCRFFSRLVDLEIEDDSKIKNLREELIKLTKMEIGPFHFYFTIISNRKFILKKLVRGKNFELNSA
ncbi:DUF1564 family protein [Leptospira yasudae]|nr:DUF1564 family protein [Leptospira yasudae]